MHLNYLNLYLQKQRTYSAIQRHILASFSTALLYWYWQKISISNNILFDYALAKYQPLIYFSHLPLNDKSF